MVSCRRYPRECFAAGSLAYDMMYGKGLTPFLAFARSQGAMRACRRSGHAGRAGRRVVLLVARRAPRNPRRSSRTAASTNEAFAALDMARASLLVLAAIVVYQFWFFGHVVWWVWFNPSTSAFMEGRLEVLQENNPERGAAPQVGAVRAHIDQSQTRADRGRGRQVSGP